VLNLLAAVFFLLLTCLASLTGAVFDDNVDGADLFEHAFQLLLIVSACEVTLGGFFFGVVTYKVADFKGLG